MSESSEKKGEEDKKLQAKGRERLLSGDVKGREMERGAEQKGESVEEKRIRKG